MTIAVSILPEQQLTALNAAYRQAVARKRLRLFAGAVVFIAALILAAIGAEVNLRTLFTYFGNFVSYFDRILTLDSGQRVWTDPGEWLWGWCKWGKLLGETLLISYVGTLIGAVCAFCLNFSPLKTLRRRPGCASPCAGCSNSPAPCRASCSP